MTDQHPMDDLRQMDREFELAGKLEWQACFSSDCHPREPRRSDPSEPVTDSNGRVFDIMEDTEPVDDLLAGATEPVDADLEIDSL